MTELSNERVSDERLSEMRADAQSEADRKPRDVTVYDFEPAEMVAALTELQQRRAADDTHRCFICNEPFQAGQMVLPDVNEGLAHRECFGEDREAYVKDTDTGEPLGPDDPIPAGEPYDPADYAPTQNGRYTAEDGLRRAREIALQSEAAPFSMGEIVKVADMALSENTPFPEWMANLISHDTGAGTTKREAPTHRHKKRGSEYVLIGIGKMQAEHWFEDDDTHQRLGPVDMHEVAIYRDVKDGSLWARPREEFEDGRFESLSTTEGE